MTLQHNNSIYKLSPTFYETIIYFGTSTFSTSKNVLKWSHYLFMLRSDLQYLKLDMRKHGNALDITKISFCSLIELESSEYTRNTELITLTSSNRTLGLGGFLTVVGQDGETRPRVCVEELYPPDNTGPGNDCSCCIFVLVVVHSACTMLWHLTK